MKRPIFWITLGYAVGVAAVIVARSRKPSLTFSEVCDEFVSLHKILWNKVNELDLADDIKSELSRIRSRLQEEVSYMERDFDDEVARLKSSGSTKVEELQLQIEELYSNRQKHIESLQDEASDLVRRLQKEGSSAYRQLEDGLMDIFDDTKSRIERKLSQIKRSLHR